MTRRLHYFDMAKGIGIFLVLLGHLQGDWFFSLSPFVLPLCTWIFSFHIPLFFVVSGMLIRYREDTERDLKTLIGKRARSIMIPYLWFSLFYLLVVVYALINGSIQVQTLFLQLWYVLGLYGMNVLWFLPALFLGEILFLWIMKKCRHLSVPAILVLTVLAILANRLLSSYSFDSAFSLRLQELAITLLRPFFALFLLACGYVVFALLKKEEKFAPVEFVLGIVLLLVNIFVHPYNGGVDFRSLVQGNIALYYISALAGSFGIILLCKNLPAIKPLTFWGANSLIVMAVHNNETVLYLGMKLAMYINQYITRARGYISYFTVVLVITLYCVLMIFVIKRFFPFIIGKPFRLRSFHKKKSE